MTLPPSQISEQKKIHSVSLLGAFRVAANGFIFLIKSQRNARIHLAATVVVVILGLVLNVDTLGWIGLVVSIAFVWVCEAFNTAIEVICDFVQPEYNEQIGHCKDLAAAAVLLASLAAILIGSLVFIRAVSTY